MKTLNFKSSFYETLKLLIIPCLLFTLGAGQMWAEKGFFDTGQWNVKYYDGSGSDKWIGEGNDGATKDLGIKTTLYLKGSWVKTWSNSGWTQSSVVWNYGLSSSYGNTKTASKSSVQGNQTWDFSVDYNVIANAPNNPGQNTIYMYWRLDNYVSSTASYINFTIPGFKKTSASNDFGNVTVSSTKDATISFTQHYGTTLTTGNCALTGANSSEFEVRSINETGVTVRFKPSTAGNKSATLTITDAHSKTCTITLSGKTQYTVSYNKGSNGTGTNTTANKVYGTSLTLLGATFTRTGFVQSGWNTNPDGVSGTSYDLGGSYTLDTGDVTLYPSWTSVWQFFNNTTLVGAFEYVSTYEYTLTVTLSSSNATLMHFKKDNSTFYVPDGNNPTTTNNNLSVSSGMQNYSVMGLSDGEYTLTIKSDNSGSSWYLRAVSGTTYSVTYEGNGNTGGTAPVDASSPYAPGSNVTVLGKGNLAKTGYTFTGWNTAPGGGGTPYAANGTISSIGENTILYAQWSENMTTVSLAASPTGAGTFTSGGSAVTSVSAGVTTHPSVTAVAATGYYVKTGTTVWTKGNNNISSIGSPNAATTTITGCGTAGTSSTLTAAFTEKYLLCGSRNDGSDTPAGMRGWSETGDNSAYESVVYNNGVLTIQANLTAAGAQYKFKLRNQQGSAWKGQTGSSSMSDGAQWTFDGTNDVYFTTTVAGIYTFTIDQLTASSPRVRLTFPGEPEYTVTFQTDGTPGSSVSLPGEQNIKPVTHTSISANIPTGLRFAGWTVDAAHNSYIHFGNASNASTWVTADAAGAGATITANFTTDGVIYLKKTAIRGAWSGTPYVCFYKSEYWSNSQGTGSATSSSAFLGGPYAMTRIGQSDIWYYDYSSTPGINNTKQYVSFVDHYLSNANNFAGCQAIYRGDFYQKAPMFVVKDWKSYYNTSASSGQAVYYNEGYWMKYNDTDPGYVIKVWNTNSTDVQYRVATKSFAADEPGGTNTYATVNLNAGSTYYYKVEMCDTTTINGVNYTGTWYGNNGTMTSTNCSNWHFETGKNNCGISTTADANYIFMLALTDGELRVSVEYPLSVGDYRVVYNGKNSIDGSVKDHPSNFIRHLSSAGTQKDTVSFYINKLSGSPTLRIQRCKTISGSTITWENTGTTINLSGIGNTNADLGVYNFEVVQTHNGSSNTLSSNLLGRYTGNYYVRTDCASGGWEAYKESKDNLMTYSDVAKESGYDYYYCKWIDRTRNIKFTVANDYSSCVSDTLVRETGVANISTYIDADGTLRGRDANVRFMYNDSTNFIGRKYIDGANDNSHHFLMLLSGDSPTKLYDAATSGNALTELTFSDNGNWIYEADVYSEPNSKVKLRSIFGSGTEVIQWFKGDAETSVPLIVGTAGSSRYKIRIVYDFKTNRLVCAWLPSGTLSVDQDNIQSDIMFIRQHQGDIEQVNFNNRRIDGIQTVYSVMQFNKSTLNGATSEYSRRYYFISFPYDVVLNEAFGFGQYAQHWIICEYNGARRAEDGFWADSPTHWEYIWDRNGVTLHKNVGYLLELELSALGNTSSIWDNTSTVELYFPSSIDVQAIQPHQIQVDVPAHLCTIGPRFEGGDDRRFKDSHWNLVGVPTYVNENPIIGWNDQADSWKYWVTDTEKDWPSGNTWATTANYLYEYQFGTNTWTAVAASGYTFHAMHAYLMQFAGTLTFNAASNSGPAAIAARRNANYHGKYDFRLELKQNGEMEDQTFISLIDDESITTEFDFNSDMSKEMNGSKPNVYTLITAGVRVAGNCLPLETEQVTTVPVGVVIRNTGEYTFAMPDGTEGLSVTLLDSETGIHTDMSLEDYTVELTAGTYENRFYLSIDPRNAATMIDEAGDPNDDVRTAKILRNGILYIQRGDKLYDSTGKLVD